MCFINFSVQINNIKRETNWIIMLHRISTPILVAVLLYHCYDCYQDHKLKQTVQSYASSRSGKAGSIHQNKPKPTEPRIHKVNDEIYVAVGYALGNSIMLIGDEGVVIIDTTESLSQAKIIAKEFRKITDKPVKGIIYSHNHADHVMGTEAFIEHQNDTGDLQIWAHHSFLDNYFQSRVRIGTAHTVRGYYQFGVYLPGPGTGLKLNPDDPLILKPPNRLLKADKERITLAGMNLDLIYVPGETDDTICVYWPKHEALLGTDNFYMAFPNLYAIRGTSFRSLKQWYESLDKMRALTPQYFVMSHNVPIVGKAFISEQMSTYRDAVQLVHDQTVRFINQNMHPDEIAARIKLPKQVKENPYLQEIYGTVKWSSKGLFSGYMGWFSGDINELDPLLPREKASRIVDLAGGINKILQDASKALIQGDSKWALYLADAAHKTYPENVKAKKLKAKALIDMSKLQTSFNGYNYYQTAALVTLGKVTVKVSSKNQNEVIDTLTARQLFDLLSLKFMAEKEKCSSMDKFVKFVFPDINQEIKFHVRNGILDMSNMDLPHYQTKPGKDGANLTVTVDSLVWKSLVKGEWRNSIKGEWRTRIKAEPSLGDLISFMSCFERD